MAGLTSQEREAISRLWSPSTIRERCRRICDVGARGDLEHFEVDLSRLPALVERVSDVTRAAYPDFQVPLHSRWHDLSTDGVDRAGWLEQAAAGLGDRARARIQTEVVLLSVLLAASAGSRWRFSERRTGLELTRSEGLGAATLGAYLAGLFSSREGEPLRADAKRLQQIDRRALRAAFQVSDGNPLAGLAGRGELVRRLGGVIEAAPLAYLGWKKARVGGLLDHLEALARGGQIAAHAVLQCLLEVFGPIWPGRETVGGVSLGDVWRHPAAGGEGPSAGLVPFHGLSQWLTSSLAAPLAIVGVEMTGLEVLTGLGEFRNGGLFIDGGVLTPRSADARERVHRTEDEFIVEWRALTVALLDDLAAGVREHLGVDESTLPMVRILKGGTWRLGRALAAELRPDGAPPILLDSDGTVF